MYFQFNFYVSNKFFFVYQDVIFFSYLFKIFHVFVYSVWYTVLLLQGRFFLFFILFILFWFFFVSFIWHELLFSLFSDYYYYWRFTISHMFNAQIEVEGLLLFSIISTFLRFTIFFLYIKARCWCIFMNFLYIKMSTVFFYF